jgi:hypothetical protein
MAKLLQPISLRIHRELLVADARATMYAISIVKEQYVELRFELGGKPVTAKKRAYIHRHCHLFFL